VAKNAICFCVERFALKQDRLYVGNPLLIGVKQLHFLASLAASAGQKMPEK
jgi:hypothetical protein